MKNFFNKKKFLASLRYSFGLGFFVFIANKIDFDNLDLFSVSWVYVTISVFPLMLFLIFQGIRFNCLLDDRMRFIELIVLQFKMQFFNLIFPGGIGGDAYRLVVLKHTEKSLISMASKSVIDRLSGLLVTAAMFVWGLSSVLTQLEMKEGMLIASWSVVVICLVVNLIALHRYWRGWDFLKKGAILIFCSFLCWAMQVCRLWLLGVAIGVDFSFQALSFVLGIFQLVILLPLSVGGLGVIEGAFVFATGLLGVSSSTAALGAVLMRITTTVSGLIGYSIWLRERRS